jgi:hypothetical protein
MNGYGQGINPSRISLRHIQTSYGAHPVSYPMSTGGCFDVAKAAGHEADHLAIGHSI